MGFKTVLYQVPVLAQNRLALYMLKNLFEFPQSTNRTLLKWLHLWDHLVFGHEKRDKKPRVQTKEYKKQEQQKKFFKNLPDVQEELDQYNRPMQKVSRI